MLDSIVNQETAVVNRPFYIATGQRRIDDRFELLYRTDLPADTRAGHDHLRQIRPVAITAEESKAITRSVAAAGLLMVDYRDDGRSWQLSFKVPVAWPAVSELDALVAALFTPAGIEVAA